MYYYLYFLILFSVVLLSGCNIVDNEIRSTKTRLFLTCIDRVYDYQKECMCEVYPKGYRKEDYCDNWTFLRMQGYLVPLDIPVRN
jgi:predicted ATPase